MRTTVQSPSESTKQGAQPQQQVTRATTEVQPMFVDNRSDTAQLKSMQALMAAGPRVQQMQSLQAKMAKPNNTGLPDNLKSGIENLSGLKMDHVKVHYNSDKPAQLNARAYAQGGDIHVAPGQEQHLPHEAWHVVQQAQGRVRPTMQMKDDVAVNDDLGLELEADVMGAKSLDHVDDSAIETNASVANLAGGTMQRMVAIAHMDAKTKDDYAVMKVAKELSSRSDAGQVVDLEVGSTDFSGMGATERLYIAGHGNRDTGNIKGVDTARLISALTHKDRGVPDTFGGVTIMSCYGGLVRSGGSLAARVAAGLRDANKGIGSTVEGAKGYAFGSPKIGEHGKASVVDLGMEGFYFLEKPAVLWHVWKGINPTHTDGILKEKYPDIAIDVNSSIGNNINAYYEGRGEYPDTREAQIKADIIAMLMLFIGRAKALQRIFENLIGVIPGSTVHEKLAVLKGQTQGISNQHKLGGYVKRWNKAVKEQEALFEKFYIWKTVADSFESVDI